MRPDIRDDQPGKRYANPRQNRLEATKQPSQPPPETNNYSYFLRDNRGGAGDDGIDGIIKEDKLGLDVVYIQAKRWTSTVGRPVVQSFAGSLEGHRARKGVLITTADFSQEARDYVQRIEKKIVLIDGRQLAQFMIDRDVGVTQDRTYVVKRIDNDYFEEE